jgi:transcriptional regulator with XRE-family HTH domain
MKTNEKIGIRISSLRKLKDVSQKALAFDAEVNRTYLSRVEKGERKISVETLEKITKALEISLMDFFNHKMFLDE